MSRDLWEYLDEEEPKAPATRALFSWSLNYDYEDRPFNLFLDLTGWSAENYGSPISNLDNVHRTIGYLEADYLGDALKEWADNPRQVEEWISGLMSCEG